MDFLMAGVTGDGARLDIRLAFPETPIWPSSARTSLLSLVRSTMPGTAVDFGAGASNRFGVSKVGIFADTGVDGDELF